MKKPPSPLSRSVVSKTWSQRAIKPVIASALALGTATAITVIPASVAQDTQSRTITAVCKTNDLPVVGSQTINLDSGITVNVTAPTSVEVDDEFEVKVDIEPIDIDFSSLPSAVSLLQASRLKLDMLRPAGTDLLDYNLEGGNLGTESAQIITVDENGRKTPTGQFLRLTDNGHNTIGNGGNVGTKSHAGLGMDLRGKKTIHLEFPAATLKFKARSAGNAVVGLRDANSGTVGAVNNAITMLASANAIFTTAWAQAGCIPSGDAGNLATIQIKDPVATATATTFESPDSVSFGQPSTFSAKVDPVVPGTMRFRSGTTQVDVPVNPETGVATTELTFNTAGSNEVTATFLPADSKRFQSSTATKSIEVTRKAADIVLGVPPTIDVGVRAEVKTTLPQGVKGTLKLETSDGQSRAQSITNGGDFTTNFVFAEPGEVSVTASFTPAADSPIELNPAKGAITVETAKSTSLTLDGVSEDVPVGTPATITARVNGAPDTTNTDGAVQFEIDGRRVNVPVVDGVATVSHTFTRIGTPLVRATYLPGEASDQTEAITEAMVNVVAQQSQTAQITIDGPNSVSQGASTTYNFNVAPVTNGQLTVFVDGRKVAENVEVANGAAQADITIPRGAAGNHTLRAEFRAEGSDKVTAVQTKEIAAVPVTNVGTVEGALEADSYSVEAGKEIPVRFIATPTDAGVAREDIFGYVELSNNGTVIKGKDGQPVRIPVVEGVADMNVRFASGTPAANELIATFHSAEGTKITTAQQTFTVTSGTDGGDDSGSSLGSLDEDASGSLGSLGSSNGQSSTDSTTPVVTPAGESQMTDSPAGDTPRGGFMAFLNTLMDFFKKFFSLFS